MTPSNRDAVQFTRESSERIARVVRAAELAPTPGTPLTFDPVLMSGSGRKVFRMGTFTGDWPNGTAKTVTLFGSTATLSAINLFVGLPYQGVRNCAVARDGTAWYLIQWQWDVSSVLSNATLDAALEFQRIDVPSLGTATPLLISVTTCSTATAS